MDGVEIDAGGLPRHIPVVKLSVSRMILLFIRHEMSQAERISSISSRIRKMKKLGRPNQATQKYAHGERHERSPMVAGVTSSLLSDFHASCGLPQLHIPSQLNAPERRPSIVRR
jgi:hypothetical protein